MTAKEIRRLGTNEVEEAVRLVMEVFAQYVAPHMDQEGIDEFMSFIDPEYLCMKMGEGEIRLWGAFEDGELAGVLGTRGLNHICLLFVKREFQRRGIGASLLKKAALDMMVLDPAAGDMTVNAGSGAIPFYKAMGFEETGEERRVNGIAYTPMKITGKDR